MIDRVYLIAPLVGEAAKFLMTFKDYPPSGMAGSFNLTKMQKQIEEASKGGK
jgi:arylsulfatase